MDRIELSARRAKPILEKTAALDMNQICGKENKLTDYPSWSFAERQRR